MATSETLMDSVWFTALVLSPLGCTVVIIDAGPGGTGIPLRQLIA